MNRRELIRLAWDNWHSDLDREDIPSQVNPLFSMAFEAGWEAAVAEAREVLSMLDGLADQWGDEAVFRRCRDRLRAMTTQP
jgi:hypothetical protein